MTSEEIRNRISRKLGKEVNLHMGIEYEHVIGFRLRPGELLCIVKRNGNVIWEDELPDELAPRGEGTIYLLD